MPSGDFLQTGNRLGVLIVFPGPLIQTVTGEFIALGTIVEAPVIYAAFQDPALRRPVFFAIAETSRATDLLGFNVDILIFLKPFRNAARYPGIVARLKNGTIITDKATGCHYFSGRMAHMNSPVC
jgi:hypothetical protein